MEPTKVDPEITKDVLNLGHGSQLTPEQIAKALAHHKKHGHEDKEAEAKANAGKKGK
jgi:hypothetical protein